MNIPALFYGKAADVKKRVKHIVNKLGEGKTWDEIITAEFVNTDLLPGLIVIDGPSKILGAEEHFQVYTLMRYVLYDRKASEDIIENIFLNSIKTDWGLLLLLNYQSYSCFDGKDHRQKLFLNAVYERFNSLEKIGKRYSAGLPDPNILSALPNAIYYCLSVQGFDVNKVIAGSRDMSSLHELLKEFHENEYL